MNLCTLLAAVAVAVIPAVLWAVPHFRRRGGAFLTPAKSVPCGCLPLILLPELLWELWRWYCGADYDRYLFPVTCGILVITLPVAVAAFRFVDRRQRKILTGESNPGRESEPLMYVIVFFFFALLGFGGCVVGCTADAARMMFSQDYCGEWYYTAIPVDGPVKLAFGSQSIHPFLAEYNYRLRFDDGKQVSTHWLHTNCGGRTFFNVYRLPDGRLRLADKDGEYLVDPQTRAVLKLIRRGAGMIYAVPYPDELVTSSSGPYEQNGKYYCNFNRRRVEASPAEGILDDEVYYGRITRYFDDARKAPEVPLERYREVR